MRKCEESLQELWNVSKRNNICISWVPERDEKKRVGVRSFKEIKAKKFPNLGRATNTLVSEAHRPPYRLNPRKTSLRHIVIKLPKIKDEEKFESRKRIEGNPSKAVSIFHGRNLAEQERGE